MVTKWNLKVLLMDWTFSKMYLIYTIYDPWVLRDINKHDLIKILIPYMILIDRFCSRSTITFILAYRLAEISTSFSLDVISGSSTHIIAASAVQQLVRARTCAYMRWLRRHYNQSKIPRPKDAIPFMNSCQKRVLIHRGVFDVKHKRRIGSQTETSLIQQIFAYNFTRHTFVHFEGKSCKLLMQITENLSICMEKNLDFSLYLFVKVRRMYILDFVDIRWKIPAL